ncbi:MAG: hypothetical protein LBH14_00305 [Desulfobulbaceae bacterium]|jgi:tetratricopeptide (TPR) repeat protein|nr:hypothetical protein [Desulfobulbaceae bacterium]
MPQPNPASRAITRIILILCALCAVGACAANAPNEDIDLLPKYGPLPKDAAQRATEEQFIAKTDAKFHGDRKRAASDLAKEGWHLLAQDDVAAAMRLFNQAWLLDNENGSALWGMAALRSHAGKSAEAMILFNEAAPLVGNDIDFMTDQAKAIGFAGLQQKDKSLINNALIRFAYTYKLAPRHTRNLENWAKLLYLLGQYREAWGKINLAMATPGKDELDPAFISKLRGKMPRP